eukprot:TRINITY_DN11277_c0_g6_i1.p1 TRINITY_DN11277_c0_g6~~TRINITY_DN11277_c0_g6_i1.p1  ORF type:complete len:399 (-),score=83.75 TRINITY_DN11277_c0_g6_i1:8-1180(-)
MIRRPPRSTHCISSAASDVYKRQVQRNIFKINKSIPGPGQYNPLTENQPPKSTYSTNRIANQIKPSTARTAKKPDDTAGLRGPGYYETILKWPNSRRQAFRKLPNANKSCDFAARVQNGPGPGHYNVGRRFAGREGSVGVKVGSKPQTAPFNTTEERKVQSEVRNPSVGPGTYIDVNNPFNSSVTKNLLKYAVDKGIMMAHGLESKPFGVGGKRFDKGYFTPKEGPGPADYAPAEETPRPKHTLGFPTVTERLVERTPKETAEAVQIRSEVEVALQFGKQSVKQTRTPYYQTFSGKSIAFDSTQSRWARKVKERETIPGPGHYLTNISVAVDNKAKHQKKSFNVTEGKFNPRINSYFNITSTGNKVGPGSYTVESDVVKRSFNINSYTFD